MFTVDHDFHIHSQFSHCSRDPLQTAERLLTYAEENHMSRICVTDHFWDESIPGASSWYAKQNFAHVSKILPLPKRDGVKLFFGCETELDKNFTLGISRERMDSFDFIIIPTTHLHMSGFTIDVERDGSSEARARLWVERFDAVLNMDLPFHKIGIAHLTCSLMAKDPANEYLRVLSMISDEEMHRLFARASALGVGIELNVDTLTPNDAELEIILRPYRIAKEEGCKFYFGSDAHHPASLHTANIRRLVRFLRLEESDKFKLPENSVLDALS